MTTTLIRNAEWVIAWDPSGKRQVYRKNIDVAFQGDAIVHVGPRFSAAATTIIDGQGLMVMPGFVDIHAHPSHEPVYRGSREEHGVANMYMSSLYERSQAFDTSDSVLQRASLEVALCELLRSGVTTVCDISPIYDG
jgi:5-methylthioadenosine/S-adenosylhomocysteine deaminase